MKRFKILKLYNIKIKSKIPGWKEINESIPSDDCIVKVRLENGGEIKAMFFLDKCSWGIKYGYECSYFWDYQTEEPLKNVTHWNEEFGDIVGEEDDN